MKLSFKVVCRLVIVSLTPSICIADENNNTQEVATNFTSDVGASKESDETTMDIRADSPRLERGEFVLERRQLVIPDDGAQIFWNCVGGYDSNYARLVVGNSGVDIENNIDTSTWTDPVYEMNTTLNKDIQQIAELESTTILGAVGCTCGLHQLNFGEWLRVNNERNSTFGVDVFSVPAFFMPSNWRNVNAPYGPGVIIDNTAWIDSVETPYNNIPPVAVNSFGLKKPELALSSTPGGTAIFTSTNDLVTTNKFIKIHSDGGPVTIRAMSKGRYNLVVFLIREDPPYLYVSNEFDQALGIQGRFPSVAPFNQVEMYTDRSAASTFSETKAYILPPPTDGYYYQLMIKNDEDGSFNDFEHTDDDLKCTMSEYGLELKNSVSLSFESCVVTACNGRVINAVPTDPNEASKNVGHMMLLLAMPLLLGNLLFK